MARLAWGLIGGGEGSQIGPVHRIASALDARFDLRAGALDADPARGRDFAQRLGIAPERVFGLMLLFFSTFEAFRTCSLREYPKIPFSYCLQLISP